MLITNIKGKYFKYRFKTKVQVQIIYAVNPLCLQGLHMQIQPTVDENIYIYIISEFQEAKLELAAQWQLFT